MQPQPGTHKYRPVAGSLRGALVGRLRPGIRILAVELIPVAAWSAGSSRRPGRIGVEAATGSQTDEDLRGAAFEPLLQFYGVVAGIEDEQRECGPFIPQPTEQPLHMLGGDRVDILCGGTRSTSTGAVQLSRAKPS